MFIEGGIVEGNFSTIIVNCPGADSSEESVLDASLKCSKYLLATAS